MCRGLYPAPYCATCKAQLAHAQTTLSCLNGVPIHIHPYTSTFLRSGSEHKLSACCCPCLSPAAALPVSKSSYPLDSASPPSPTPYPSIAAAVTLASASICVYRVLPMALPAALRIWLRKCCQGKQLQAPVMVGGEGLFKSGTEG